MLVDVSVISVKRDKAGIMSHKQNTPQRIAYWRVIRQVENVIRNNDRAISIITKNGLKIPESVDYYVLMNTAWEEVLQHLKDEVHRV